VRRGGVAQQTSYYWRHHEEVAASLTAEMEIPLARGRRALVALAGLPAAGKSHLARLLAERLGGVVVSSDGLRRRLFIAPSYARQETRAIFAVAHAIVRGLLRDGHVVIFDATNLRESDRRPLYRVAEQAGAAFLLVRVIAPEDEIYARLERRRAQGPPADASEADRRVYEALRERYEEPTCAYITVAASGDLEVGLAEVVAAVEAACA
jgi:predicted kinase